MTAMRTRFYLSICFLLAIFILPSSSYSQAIGNPDYMVKVIYDNLSAGKKCKLGVFKNGNLKKVDERYRVLSYDMHILNYRGQRKWYSKMEKVEIEFTEDDDVEIVSGDLVVIDNVVLIHVRSGNIVEVKEITERYLVK
jgi:hypothetical protein